MGKSASIDRAVMLILAAGLATRMGGRVKPDLPWIEGRTLLEHQEFMAQAMGFPTLAVTRIDEGGLNGRIINPHPERGLAESLKCGVDAVRQQWGMVAVGVLLADQPFVAKEDIARVYEAFCQRPSLLHAVRPRYDGVPGHPVFFDATWDEALQALTGDVGLGKLWNIRDDAGWVDVGVGERPDPSFDIDTDTAYRQALRWVH